MDSEVLESFARELLSTIERCEACAREENSTTRDVTLDFPENGGNLDS